MYRFSHEELKELAIAATVITFVYTYPAVFSPAGLPVFVLYFLFVGMGFAVHESAHKFAAIKRGAWSEFRMWKDGLMFAVLMRIIGGPVIIAPGATLWMKPFATEEDQGKVSIAGPLSNIILALIFFVLAQAVPIMRVGTQINLDLAMFNLIPFPPLDGHKIIRWRPLIWAATFVFVVAAESIL